MHTPNLKVKGDEMSVGYLLFMQLETDSPHLLANVLHHKQYDHLRHPVEIKPKKVFFNASLVSGK